jgi:hypothetical protein
MFFFETKVSQFITPILKNFMRHHSSGYTEGGHYPGGKMDDLYTFFEQLFYDSRPVIYAALAFYSFVNKESTPILVYCGLILTVCSLYVMNKRYSGGKSTSGRMIINIK